MRFMRCFDFGICHASYDAFVVIARASRILIELPQWMYLSNVRTILLFLQPEMQSAEGHLDKTKRVRQL